MAEVRYRGGSNVAMKLPPHHFDGAVKFYRDTLGLTVSDHGESKLVEFGPIRLWLDRCPQFSQAELWLDHLDLIRCLPWPFSCGSHHCSA